MVRTDGNRSGGWRYKSWWVQNELAKRRKLLLSKVSGKFNMSGVVDKKLRGSMVGLETMTELVDESVLRKFTCLFILHLVFLDWLTDLQKLNWF